MSWRAPRGWWAWNAWLRFLPAVNRRRPRRYGLALLRVTKRQLKGEGLDADAWWARIAAITHSRKFDANALHAAAYSPVYRGGVRPVRLRREEQARESLNEAALRREIEARRSTPAGQV